MTDHDTVLITGAAGTIGSELASSFVFRDSDAKFVFLDINENGLEFLRQRLEYEPTYARNAVFHVCDLRNRLHIQNILDTYWPDHIIHCAAHKHVSCSENNVAEAVNNNLQGTINLAAACRLNGSETSIIHISTDMAVMPTSVMGASKALCESIMLNLYSSNCRILRLGNILDSQGSVLRIWKYELDNGLPFTITDWSMERLFLNLSEVAQQIPKLASHEPGVYFYDSAQWMSVRRLFDLFISEYDVMNPKINIVGAKPGEKVRESLSWPSEKITLLVDEFAKVEGTPIFSYQRPLACSRSFRDDITLEALREVFPSVWR